MNDCQLTFFFDIHKPSTSKDVIRPLIFSFEIFPSPSRHYTIYITIPYIRVFFLKYKKKIKVHIRNVFNNLRLKLIFTYFDTKILCLSRIIELWRFCTPNAMKFKILFFNWKSSERPINYYHRHFEICFYINIPSIRKTNFCFEIIGPP